MCEIHWNPFFKATGLYPQCGFSLQFKTSKDHYPKWCYVSARDLPDGEFKNLCSEYTWFWCNAAEQRPTAARWKLLPGATLLGNEKRFETIYLLLSEE